MSLNKSQALSLAREYVLQRKIEAAIDTYRRIIEADPADLTTINALGDLYVGANRVQEAIAQFLRVADGYLHGNMPRKAIAALSKILALDPSNLQITIKLAELYAATGLTAEARRYYLQIAEAYSVDGRTADALEVYRKIVDLDPSNPATRIKLGEIYLRDGMNDLAYESFITAAEQLASKGENRRARNAYNEALAIKPNNPEVIVAAHSLQGGTARSEPLRHAPTTAATTNVASMRLPEHSLGSGRIEDKTDSPDSAFVVQQISKAEILVGHGKVNDAVMMLRAALRQLPDNLDIHNKLKDIYLRTGMLAEAARESGELARIHRARGEDDRARDHAVRANRLTQSLERAPAEQREMEVVESPIAQLVPPAVSRETVEPVAIGRAPNEVVLSKIQNGNGNHLVKALSVQEAPPPISLKVSHSEALEVPAAALPIAVSPTVLQFESAASLAGEMAQVLVAPSQAADFITGDLPAIIPASAPVKRRRHAVVWIGIPTLALLAGGAIIGRHAYDVNLNKQYEALSAAAGPSELPEPPPLVSEAADSAQPSESFTVDVMPSNRPETPVRAETAQPEPVRNEPAPPPQPSIETPKIPARSVASPPPPTGALNTDNRAATDNRVPSGVPMAVPAVLSGGPGPVEPPKAVRTSATIVHGGALRKVDPVYPANAREARITGVVTVEVNISEQGSVTSARAISGPPIFLNSAVSAARNWTFKPSTLGGVPVKTTTTIVFNFKL